MTCDIYNDPSYGQYFGLCALEEIKPLTLYSVHCTYSSAGSQWPRGSNSIVSSDPCLTLCLTLTNVQWPWAALERAGVNQDRLALIQVRADDQLLLQ